MKCWGTKTIASFGNQLQGKSDHAGLFKRKAQEILFQDQNIPDDMT